MADNTLFVIITPQRLTSNLSRTWHDEYIITLGSVMLWGSNLAPLSRQTELGCGKVCSMSCSALAYTPTATKPLLFCFPTWRQPHSIAFALIDGLACHVNLLH